MPRPSQSNRWAVPQGLPVVKGVEGYSFVELCCKAVVHGCPAAIGNALQELPFRMPHKAFAAYIRWLACMEAFVIDVEECPRCSAG